MEDLKTHKVVLKPTGVELRAPSGSPLKDLLFEHGAEFPCGGQGRCRGCRIQVLAGSLPVNSAQQERLSAAELVRAGDSPASA